MEHLKSVVKAFLTQNLEGEAFQESQLSVVQIQYGQQLRYNTSENKSVLTVDFQDGSGVIWGGSLLGDKFNEFTKVTNSCDKTQASISGLNQVPVLFNGENEKPSKKLKFSDSIGGMDLNGMYGAQGGNFDPNQWSHDGKGFNGKGFEGKGFDGKGAAGKGFDGKGVVGMGFDGKGAVGMGFNGLGMQKNTTDDFMSDGTVENSAHGTPEKFNINTPVPKGLPTPPGLPPPMPAANLQSGQNSGGVSTSIIGLLRGQGMGTSPNLNLNSGLGLKDSSALTDVGGGSASYKHVSGGSLFTNQNGLNASSGKFTANNAQLGNLLLGGGDFSRARSANPENERKNSLYRQNTSRTRTLSQKDREAKVPKEQIPGYVTMSPKRQFEALMKKFMNNTVHFSNRLLHAGTPASKAKALLIKMLCHSGVGYGLVFDAISDINGDVPTAITDVMPAIAHMAGVGPTIWSTAHDNVLSFDPMEFLQIAFARPVIKCLAKLVRGRVDACKDVVEDPQSSNVNTLLLVCDPPMSFESFDALYELRASDFTTTAAIVTDKNSTEMYLVNFRKSSFIDPNGDPNGGWEETNSGVGQSGRPASHNIATVSTILFQRDENAHLRSNGDLDWVKESELLRNDKEKNMMCKKIRRALMKLEDTGKMDVKEVRKLRNSLDEEIIGFKELKEIYEKVSRDLDSASASSSVSKF